MSEEPARVSAGAFITRVIREQPLRFTLVVGSLGVVGLLEGAGVAVLLPLLQLVSSPAPNVQASGRTAQLVAGALALVGLPFTLTTVLAFTLVLVLLQQAMTLVQQKITWGSIYGFEASLRESLYDRVFRAGWPFFLKAKSADLMNALTVEANRAGTAYLYLSQMLGAVFVVAVYLLLAAFLSWQMTLIIAIVGLLLAIGLRGRVSLGAGFGLQVTETNADLQAEAMEHIVGAKLVKGTASEQATVSHFRRLADVLAHVQYKAGMNQTWLKVFYDTASTAGILVGIYLAVARFHMSVASLIVFLFIFYRVSPRLSNLQSLQHTVLSYLPSVARIDELAEQARDLTEPNGDVTVERFKDRIDFSDVTFAYETGKPVIRHVSLEVPKGRMVGIVGPSGSGKTTLVDMLMGLLVPTHGRVLVDGVPLEDLERGSWRRLIGYVAQDSSFFHASVKENIAGGLDDVPFERIVEAARTANAEEFVERLPHGYDTIIGDRGVRLSGGQRQRLALARAVLRRPDLLILDEATSALDAESEAKIMGAVEHLAKSTTIVMVTHRLASVRPADVIYFLENGEVVETGTWQELSASGHRFAELKALQELG